MDVGELPVGGVQPVVSELHGVGHDDALGVVAQQRTDPTLAPGHHAGQGVATLTPQLDDVVVLAAVDVHDVLCFVLGQVNTDVTLSTLERVTQLGCPGHVTKAEDAGLTNEPLHLVCLGDLALVDFRCELRVHIPVLTELLHQIGLTSEVGHHAGFDLTAVTADDLVPLRCTQCPADGVVAPAG